MENQDNIIEQGNIDLTSRPIVNKRLSEDEWFENFAKRHRQEQEQQAAQFQEYLERTMPRNPDKAAEAQNLAKIYGVDVSVIERNQDAYVNHNRVRAVRSVMRNYPQLQRRMTDPNFAAIAHDDIEMLGGLEEIVRNIGRASGRGYLRGEEGLSGWISAAMTNVLSPIFDPWLNLIPGGHKDSFRRAGKVWERSEEAWKHRAESTDWRVIGNPGKTESAIYSGIESITQFVMSLPAYSAGSWGPLVMFGGMVGGEEYGEGLRAGYSPGRAALYGLSQGVPEALLERAPFMAALSGIANRSGVLKTAFNVMLKEVPQEQVTTLIQDFNRQVFIRAAQHPEKGFGQHLVEYLSERPDAAYQTLVATIVGSAGNVAIMSSIDNLLRKESLGGVSELHQRLLDQLINLSKDINLIRRDPKAYADFVEAVGRESEVETVYISSEAFAQQGLSEQLSAVSPEAAQQLQEPIAENGYVQISLREFANNVAPNSAIIDQIRLHTTFNPDIPTPAQREAFDADTETRETIERAMAEDARLAALDAQRVVIMDDIRTQLEAAGRPAKESADVALLASSMFNTIAQNIGVTTEAFYAQYGHRILRGIVQGEGFSQAAQATLEAEIARWRNAIGDLNRGKTVRMKTPAVLREMGVRSGEISFSPTYWQKIVRDHGHEIPSEVVTNLTDFLHDPLLSYPAPEGGVNVLIDAMTQNGEPIIVGIRNGEIRTITPQHNVTDGAGDVVESGWDRLKARLAALLKANTKSPVYVRDRSRPENSETAAATRAGAVSAMGSYWDNSIGSFSHGSRRVFSRARLVNRLGENYYQSVQQDVPRGFTSFEERLILLTQTQDSSTAIHEFGHMFLSIYADLSQQFTMKPEADITAGERRIIEDTQALLDWFGVPSIDAWNQMTVDEQTPHHEKLARGFERYIHEGVAPSSALMRAFRRLSNFIRSVYKSLKAHNVTLTPAVRAVFDRMIASEAEINRVMRARGSMPLIDNAELANMTPEEFDEYLQQFSDAVGVATDAMQAKALRDMRWLHYARGREIKRLQRQATQARAQAEMDARREVMSQPVYRAWQFLTAPLRPQDRIGKPPQQRKATPRGKVDESIDSLFEAISKLGGMNREELASLWGLKPEEKATLPKGWKIVIRNKGGLSVSKMEEALTELGYLPDDPSFSNTYFESAFFDELRGVPQYSSAYEYGILEEIMAGEQVANPQALGAGRLDISALDDFGKESSANLRERGMTAKDGLHPEIVAGMFGFDNGAELVDALAAATPPEQAIAQIADARMLEQHGELATPQAIERAADEAIANDAMVRFSQTELSALEKAYGGQRFMNAAAREYARVAIARMMIDDINPQRFSATAQKNATEAEKALRSGDIETAAAFTRTKVLNQMLSNEANRVLNRAKREYKYILNHNKRGRHLLPGYSEQVWRIIDRFIAGEMPREGTTLADWLEQLENNEGPQLDLADIVTDENERKPWGKLTLEEALDVGEAVRQITAIGKRDERFLDSLDAMQSNIRENYRGKERVNETPATPWGKKKEAIDIFFSRQIKASTDVRVLDGGVDGGLLWDLLLKPINDAGNLKAQMSHDGFVSLDEILKPVKKAIGNITSAKYSIGNGKRYTMEQIFSIALNSGNKGNLQRIEGGNGFTAQHVQEAFKNLPPVAVEAVQKIWDFIETYRPLIAALERRMLGREPQWVEPQAITVTDSEGNTHHLRGGYYPIKYDPKASVRAEQQEREDTAKLEQRASYTSATTRRTFAKPRVNEVFDRPILLSLQTLFNGVNEIIHDISHREAVHNANRVIRSNEFKNAVRETRGAEMYKRFQEWIKDVAIGESFAMKYGEEVSAWLPRNVGIAAMGYSATTSALQFTGIVQSINRVGARWIVHGVAESMRMGPIDAARAAANESLLMANRARTLMREINEVMNTVRSNEPGIISSIRNHSFLFISFCQRFVDVPTYYGAKAKALANGADEVSAIAQAEQAVLDSQAGGQIKDLSAWHRSKGLMRVLSPFTSYFNSTFNLLAAKYMLAETPAEYAALTKDVAQIIILPAILTYIVMNALIPGGGDEWDDPEKFLRGILNANLEYAMGTLLVVRELSFVTRQITGVPGLRGYSGPAGVRVIGDTGNFLIQVSQGEADSALRRSFVQVLGLYLGLPSTQFNRSYKGIEKMIEGDTSNPLAPVFGYQEYSY
ncbi:MAG: hypothetical protein LBE22_10340 [Azoarcus sp.]|jgi:hypothetical protein|nr:hypothetical protein [Azoarcus sp.]